MAGEVRVEILDDGLADGAGSVAERMAAEGVAGRLSDGDASLWGAEAEPEASVRLAWTGLHETSRPLLAEIEALRAELHAEGVHRVVLAGMGGSSLAPEVITRTAGVSLVVLDTTDAAQVADALEGDLDATVLVVSSKSGSTVETDSHRRIFERAFADEGIDAASRIVVVTDPGSPLESQARQAGYRAVFTADPNVGGRYSALTAFGLVPAGLAGADISALLDEAAALAPTLGVDEAANPALRLAGALSTAHATGAEKVVFADSGSGIVGFADWAEQLVAESTGKQGTGLLPVAVENVRAPGFADAGSDATTVTVGPATGGAAIATTGGLGGLMLLWEHATAHVGRLLGINPFDQPDVEAAKKAARALLDSPATSSGAPRFVVDEVEVHAGDWLPEEEKTLAGAVRALLAAAPEHGYLSVQAYLDRIDDASAELLRPELARRSGLQTTFGWGPRFLHSTGQYHKGGHPNGVYLQLTGTGPDIAVPGREYTLATLQQAQALGDASVLADHLGRPMLRLHLADRLAGLAAVVRAVQEIGT